MPAVTVKIGPALKKSYGEEMKTIDRARSQGASAWHELYLATARIMEHDPPLYIADGHTTDGEFLAAELQESRQSAYRNIRVAKLATAAEVAHYSATRLHYAIAYLDAKTGQRVENRKAINFATVRIEFKLDGKVSRKTLDKVTYAELHEAIAQLRPKPTAKKQAVHAKEILEALKRSGVKGATAIVTKQKVTLRAPLDGFEAIIRELSGFKLTPRS